MGKSCVKSDLWTPSLSLDTFKLFRANIHQPNQTLLSKSENQIISIVTARE